MYYNFQCRCLFFRVAIDASFSDVLSIHLCGFFFSCWRPIATKCRNAFPLNIDFKTNKKGRGNSWFFSVKIMVWLLRRVAWQKQKKKTKGKALKYFFNSNFKELSFLNWLQEVIKLEFGFASWNAHNRICTCDRTCSIANESSLWIFAYSPEQGQLILPQ